MKQLVKWLLESTYTVVFTGAGMSTESGLPDFRSALRGIWKNRNPIELASVQAMKHNRDAFLDFYTERIKGVKQCIPNAGHFTLAKWEGLGFVKSIITQNVDGFHHQAGSKNISELHGTLRSVHCEQCNKSFSNDRFLQFHYTCECGGAIRPSVVLFGEGLPMHALQMAEAESAKSDLFIVLGSSLQVSPANYFPVLAKEHGAKLVIVNLENTELDYLADLLIQDESIGEVLSRLDMEINRSI
ncbi:NAD-dependent deacylase [Bacillus salitolerans]|uniref:protein acetyllysine N-acetyltransferase n=1 Tax=Bacillus salitolerans TaxID=1437434 RepID=A0ABW4LJX0_9BACI